MNEEDKIKIEKLMHDIDVLDNKIKKGKMMLIMFIIILIIFLIITIIKL